MVFLWLITRFNHYKNCKIKEKEVIKMVNINFDLQIETSNSPPQEAELRLEKALNMLINFNDINFYEQQKNDI